ncbi:MAG: elongation factor P [Clostridia bacterium]
MIATTDFKTGLTVEIDGGVYQIIEFQHVKPGKGAAFVRTKMRNRKSGGIMEKTFRAGEKVAPAHIERISMQYLYNDGNDYTFMDNETFEQLMLTKDQLGDAIKYLIDNMTIEVAYWKNQPIGVDLPNTVILKVVETEPGVKGDTATNVTKAAIVETGASIQVPIFVNEGDSLVIDTRTGVYIQRA